MESSAGEQPESQGPTKLTPQSPQVSIEEAAERLLSRRPATLENKLPPLPTCTLPNDHYGKPPFDRSDIARPFFRMVDADFIDFVVAPSSSRNPPPRIHAQLSEGLRNIAIILQGFQSRAPQNLWDKGTSTELATLAINLADSMPNTRFVGVGNSPSYVVYGISRYSEVSNANIVTEYVPFSGRYLTSANPYRSGTLDYSYDLFSTQRIDALRFELPYQARLDELGLNPKHVVATYLETKQKTAVIDNIQGGTSFASFMHFMYSWAESSQVDKATFQKAFDCVALTAEPIRASMSIPAGTHSNSNARVVIPVTSVEISEQLRLALNSNFSMETDRFIPHYSPDEWGRPPQEVVHKNAPQISVVKNLINDAIAEKVAHRPGPMGPALRTKDI